METLTSRFEPSGRILIPAEWRRRLNLRPGEDILLGLENGQIVILGTREQVVRKAQQRMKMFGDPNKLWSEELSQERREEAERER
jgi:AbrB family looped-hinge helix DNA binding protein